MKVILRISLVVFLAIGIFTGGLLLWFYSGVGLPRLSSLTHYEAAQNSKIFAADGTLLTELHGEENREIIALEKIPDSLCQAVVAVEDGDFYRHRGINWKAVLRALWANVVRQGVVQGGSTITQQYVKNAYVGPKRTLWRKIQEANLAYQLESKYSKDKIMELYLNDIYFGQGCYGIFTASQKYFNKQPQALTLSECAMLSAVIRSPSYYDPYLRPQAVIDRRNLVLKKMEQQGFIKHDQSVAAMNEQLQVVPPNRNYVPPPAPYFCDYITEKLRSDKKYGDKLVYRGGLRIYTTIDLRLQGLAEQTLARELNPEKGPDAAIICIDPKTGYIKAMVGGKNYYLSQYNVAAQGHRQAGSAFKVFVLSRALADRVSPELTYDSSSPKTVRLPDGTKWIVNNYDGHGSGSMTIRSATIHSVNVVFAQLIMDVGPKRVSDMAEAMGIMSEVDTNPAIALGGLSIGVTPLDMATAFGTLANNGVHAIPRSVFKITDAGGNVLEENNPEAHTILAPKVAAEANDILQQVVSSGTGTGARIGRPQAGKTGTTEDHADAWFVGYTPDLVTAVWVGYPQGRISMSGMTGGSLPASIWQEFMSKALEDTPPTPFPESEEKTTPAETHRGEQITVKLCGTSGLLATPYCPQTHYREFNRGEEPTEFCNVHKSATTSAIPNVVGLTESAARAALSEAGYQVQVTKQESNRQVAGTVISQTPAAGASLSSGSTVTITVSTGLPQNTVPSVIGLSEATAVGRIEAAGFTAVVNYAAGGAPGTVVSQSPGGGTRLPAGSNIFLLVGRSEKTTGNFDFLGFFARL